MSRNWTALSKIWKRCTLKKADGTTLNVCFVQLPTNRSDEVVDFQMSQFVPREITHIMSGLPYNKEAMMEYRDVLRQKHSDPLNFSMVCCIEKDNKILPNFIASDSMKLIKRGDPCKDETPPNLKTKEANDYFRIVRDWNNLCPIPYVMEKFDLETFYDDRGIVVHQEYAGYNIAYHLSLLRRVVCQSQGVPMTGAWLAAIGSEKAALRTGWQLVYEVSREDLEKVVKVPMDKSIPSFKFCVLDCTKNSEILKASKS